MDQVTLTGTLSGLAIGSLILCANFQFGLQTGWVSMMSMPAALLGFAWFKVLSRLLTPQENVYIQSVAVAVGTGPLSFGFVGAIPAIEKLITKREGRVSLGVPSLIVWSFGVAFMGIFAAVLLRKFILHRQKLRFPSGAAAAALIGVLHDKPTEGTELADQPQLPVAAEDEDETRAVARTTYRRNIEALVATFAGSSVYTAVSRVVPLLRALPVFGGFAAKWMWVLDPSPAYIGQGMIMGLPTTMSMLLGAVLGWGILGPLAKHMGWAPGSIDDWQNGSQGWVMWVSLAIMIADTLVSFGSLSLSFGKDMWHYIRVPKTEYEESQRLHNDGADHAGSTASAGSIDDDPCEGRLAIGGLVAASVICVVVTKLLFPTIPVGALVLAVMIAPFLSLLGIRALGQTDLNPVSSIAKLTQILFGAVLRKHPHAVLANIVAGAITEAGAQQAGDLMQDFKSGALLKASVPAQTLGMAIGTCWSIVVSAVVYQLYNRVYEIPGKEFRIPTAYIWADCARIMQGEGLPTHAAEAAMIFFALFLVLEIIKLKYPSPWIPSGVAVGIGMYNIPSFTLARAIGGIIAGYCAYKYPGTGAQVYMVILSSGLILGEGVMSVLALVMSLVWS